MCIFRFENQILIQYFRSFVEDTTELLQDVRRFRRETWEQQQRLQQQKEDLHQRVKQQHQDSSNVTIHESDQIINKIKHQVPTCTSIRTWLFYVPTYNDSLHHSTSLKSLQVINNWEKLKSYFRNFDPAGCATIPANNMKVSTLCF